MSLLPSPPPLWSQTERQAIQIIQAKKVHSNHHLKQIQAALIRRQIIPKNIKILNALIHAFANAKLAEKAIKIFKQYEHKHDNQLRTTATKILVKSRKYRSAIDLYRSSNHCHGFAPDEYTFPVILKAAAALADGRTAAEGRQIHGHVVKFGFCCDLFAGTGLVDLYAKGGDLEDARKVFDEMPVRGLEAWTALVVGYARFGDVGVAWEVFRLMPVKDTVAFNAMIDGFVRVGDLVSARRVFDGMSVRNVISWTSLLVGYCRDGDMEGAGQLFNEMPEKNLYSWNVMIGGCCRNRRPDRALELFRELQERCCGLEPDDVTAVSVLPAVADMGAIELGRWIHSYARRKGFDRWSNVGTALVDMYAKCGDVFEARRIFHGIDVKEVVSWNALIHGLAVNGHPKEALDVFVEMQGSGACPNEVTMIGVLSACGHGGLVDEGRRWFREMDALGVTRKIEHYGCMVDILGRGGYLEEAEKLINEMPYEPNGIVLSSLLFACGCYGDVNRAERVMKIASKIEPANVTNYVIMRNLYAREKRWTDVDRIKEMVWEFGGKRDAGCSLIEIASRVREFVSGDRAHSDWEHIYRVLGQLKLQMKGQQEKEWELNLLTHL